MNNQSNASGNYIETFTSNAIFALSGRFTGKLLQALIQIVLARSLGAKLFGIYSIGWVAFTLAGTIAPLGLDNGVIRFATKHWRNDFSLTVYIIKRAILISATSGMILGIFFFILAPQASKWFGESQLIVVFRLLGIALPIYSTLRVTSASTSVSQQIKYSILAEDIGQPASNILLLTISFLTGWSLLSASLATVISYAIGLSIAAYFAYHLFRLKNISLSNSKQFDVLGMFHYSFSTILASLALIFIASGNRLLLGIFKSPTDAGIFQAASQISIIFTIILSGLNSIFSPIIADLHHEEKHKQLNELFKINTKWGLYANLPFFIMVMFFPREIINAVFGNEYLDGTYPLILLSISQLINAGTGAVGLLLIMTGNEKEWLYISLGTSMASFALSIYTIPKWGINGAAISTSLGVSVIFICSLFRVRTLLNLWPYDLRYIKGLIATLITIAILSITRTYISQPNLILILGGICSVLSFYLALLILKIDPEDKTLFNIFINKVFSNSKIF